MKEFIYPEMMVHVPVCTNKTPKNVLIISDNSKLLNVEIQRHTDIKSKTIPCSLDSLRDEDKNSVDVVICEMDLDSTTIAHISRILKDDGQLSMLHDSLDDIEANKNTMELLQSYFKIIMPYNLIDGQTALLSSKEYHPTADIILQRSDMIDGLSFYNCDIHIASFAMPNYIRKEYLGFIKN